MLAHIWTVFAFIWLEITCHGIHGCFVRNLVEKNLREAQPAGFTHMILFLSFTWYPFQAVFNQHDVFSLSRLIEQIKLTFILYFWCLRHIYFFNLSQFDSYGFFIKCILRACNLCITVNELKIDCFAFWLDSWHLKDYCYWQAPQWLGGNGSFNKEIVFSDWWYLQICRWCCGNGLYDLFTLPCLV